ncbi:MAG: peptide deformylase [Spirochaetaceae bacterium]|jgi:peptide deformylase|nr:peptide deformylase [Spirochaetaceae bacterium]
MAHKTKRETAENRETLEIVTLGNDVLRQKASPVAKINAETARIVEALLHTLYVGKGVGLAGPQVGLLQRIFVVHVDKDIPRVFINPSLLETSEETVKYEEGCLSIPGVWVQVLRPKALRIHAWNEKGRSFTQDADGILARVILHEYDHLEGTLFIDRLSETKRNRILAKIEKQQRA